MYRSLWVKKDHKRQPKKALGNSKEKEHLIRTTGQHLPHDQFSHWVLLGQLSCPWLLSAYHTCLILACITRPVIRLDQISRSVVSDSLRPHESQHARPPCPLPTPGVHSDSRPSSQWCHPAISSSVVPFSSCPQSLQHQSLFQWVNSSHEVAKVLEFQLQHHSFQRNLRADLL